VCKKRVGTKMYAGIVIIIVGIALIVLFGHGEAACYTAAELRGFWLEPEWWVYVIISFGAAAFFYVVWRRYRHARKLASEGLGKELPHGRAVEPVAFSLSSALFGGGQMIVHSKLLAELFELTAASGEIAFADAFFWLELILTGVFGFYWLYRLSQCLAFYPPLFIIPLMQTSFIVFGAIAGGIYFQEFHHLHEGSVGYGAWPLYILGVLMNVGGVAFVAWDVLNSPEDEDLGTRTHELSGAPEARATASPVLPFDARPASSPPESPPDSASAGEAAQAPSVSQLPSNTKSKSPTASSRSFSGALPCSRGKVVQAAVAPVSRC